MRAAVTLATGGLLTNVRLEKGKSDCAPHPPKQPLPPPLSVTKQSWIIRTEKSNVRKEKWKKPDPPCVICEGSGRVDCHHCSGTGRTNYVHLAMLPKGEWPKWCRTCGGSGITYCSRCAGTGEYRYIMGFQFMKMDADNIQHQNLRIQGNSLGGSAADHLLNSESDSDP